MSNTQIDTTQTSHGADGDNPLETHTRLADTSSVSRTAHSPDRWRERYALRLRISDLLVLVWVVYGTQIAWFGAGEAQVTMSEDVRVTDLSYWIFSAGLVLAWMWALHLSDTRDYRVIGTGSTEYIRVADASLRLFGLVAILAFLTRIEVARGYLLIALPMGVLILVLERWMWRQWLNSKRSVGEYSARVLLVGSSESVVRIAHELTRHTSAGYLVVGACVPSGKVAEEILGTKIPIMGNVNAVDRAIEATGADTVAVTSTDDLPPSKVKQISWSLEAGQQHLVLAPNILDIAGPRIHTRPVSGLPLIHVETPRFSGGQRLLKRAMDLALSVIGMVIAAPLLLILAGIVRLSSRGPVFFRQTRVGYAGKEFSMWKFRSMVANAEDLLPDLIERGYDTGNSVLFKMKDDPRVTPVGRVMRKYSLDELPQLLNVLTGSMSLVGPRPPLPSEVGHYAEHVHRRFLAKPGITGLWQVSGRSRLSWEESVRLDLSYVENWSMAADLVILAKTVKAALAPGETTS